MILRSNLQLFVLQIQKLLIQNQVAVTRKKYRDIVRP